MGFEAVAGAFGRPDDKANLILVVVYGFFWIGLISLMDLGESLGLEVVVGDRTAKIEVILVVFFRCPYRYDKSCEIQ